IPKVNQRDAFWAMKKGEAPTDNRKHYEDIHVPKDTSMGFWIGTFACFFGFALTWHITWLTLVGIVGVVVCMIMHLSVDHTEYTLPAAEVKKIEAENLKRRLFA